MRANWRSQSGQSLVGRKAGGRDWIRTSVAVKREIYSLVDLTTLPPFQGRPSSGRIRRLDAEADETETKRGLSWERVL